MSIGSYFAKSAREAVIEQNGCLVTPKPREKIMEPLPDIWITYGREQFYRMTKQARDYIYNTIMDQEEGIYLGWNIIDDIKFRTKDLSED
jgi:hypothetical protein